MTVWFGLSYPRRRVSSGLLHGCSLVVCGCPIETFGHDSFFYKLLYPNDAPDVQFIGGSCVLLNLTQILSTLVRSAKHETSSAFDISLAVRTQLLALPLPPS